MLKTRKEHYRCCFTTNRRFEAIHFNLQSVTGIGAGDVKIEGINGVVVTGYRYVVSNYIVVDPGVDMTMIDWIGGAAFRITITSSSHSINSASDFLDNFLDTSYVQTHGRNGWRTRTGHKYYGPGPRDSKEPGMVVLSAHEYASGPTRSNCLL